VIWIHGGGWHAGNKSGCGSAFLVGQGYAPQAWNMIQPEGAFPAQIQDCQAAIRFPSRQCREVSPRPRSFGVAGDSAADTWSPWSVVGGKHAFAPIGATRISPIAFKPFAIFTAGGLQFRREAGRRRQDVRSVFKFNTPADPYSSLLALPSTPIKPRAMR